MKLKNKFLITILSATLAACGTTSIKSKRVNLASEPIKGLIYYLPRTQISYDLTHTLTHCSKDKIEIDTSISTSFKDIRDESTTFVLDYLALSNATKKSDFDIKFYENGTVKSINVQADDHTADVILGVANGITSIATANLIGSPVPIPSVNKIFDASPTYPQICKDKYREAYERAPQLKLVMDNAEKVLNDLVATIKQAMQTSGMVSSENKTELETKIQAFHTAKKAYAENQKLISFTKTVTHDEKVGKGDISNPISIYPIAPDVKNITKWLNPNYPGYQRQQGETDDHYQENIKKEHEKFVKEIIKQATLTVSIHPDDKKMLATTYDATTAEDGIFYRIPITAVINVTDADKKGVYNKRHKLNGFGKLALLSFFNDSFEENNLVVEFSDKGAITHLNYKTNAPAERITNTFNSLAEKVAEYKKEMAQKPLKDLQSQVEYLKALKDYKEYTKEEDTDIAKLNLEIKLKELAGKIEDLDKGELERELARLKLEKEIYELQNAPEENAAGSTTTSTTTTSTTTTSTQ